VHENYGCERQPRPIDQNNEGQRELLAVDEERELKMKTFKLKTRLGLAFLVVGLLYLAAGSAHAQVYNGTGSTTHSAVATAYTGGQLFSLNTTGNATPSPIVINNVPPGQALAIKALIYSTGTNKPGTSTLWLYSAPPTTTGLVDRSAYVGPYAADLAAGIYLGNLTCAGWQATNDGTAQFFSECSGSSLMLTTAQPVATLGAQTTIYALEEIGAYTPIASEKHSYFVSTLRGN
jgi:hypothetical protein